jgi:hypothetical protein
MPREFLFAKNNVAGKLAAPIGPADVTAALAPGQGALFPTTADCPYHVTVSLPGNSAIHEILHVTARNEDTLTFTRGAEGATSRDWPAESPLELRQTAQQFNDLNSFAKKLEWFISIAWGGGNGVIRYGATPDDGLKVVPGGGLKVSVQSGACFVNNLMFRLASAFTSADFSVPAQFPRVDLIEANAATGVISIKQGTETEAPVAPAVDADCLLLVHVYCRAGMVSIDASDNGTNGYIIDHRVFI